MTDTNPRPVDHSRILTRGSISTGLIQVTLPILCANALQPVNGLVASMLIGRHFGETALAAVSNAQFVMFMLTAMSFGIATAAAILVGQSVGAGNWTAAKRVVGTSATLFTTTSIILVALGLVLTEPLLVFVDAPAESRPMAVLYANVQLLALPGIYMQVLVTSLLRGTGDSKTPLYFMLVSVATGVLLNPLLIFGFGPFSGAGIVGSAYATLVANTAPLITLVIHLYNRRNPLCIKREDLSLFRFDAHIVSTLLRKGVPMSAEGLVVSLSGALMMVLVNRFGVDTVAAFGASLQLWIYIQMPAGALGVAVAIATALNTGGGQWDRVRSIVRIGVVYSISATGLLVLLVYILDTHVYQLFLPLGSPAVVIAAHINRIVAWSLIFLGVSIVLFGAVRGTGAVMVPLLVCTVTLLILRFPLAAIFVNRWQADAVWWSFPISVAFTVVLAFVYYRYGRWQPTPFRSAAPHADPHGRGNQGR